MNRVNPLQIIALLSFVILFLFFKISTLHGEIKEQKKRTLESQQIATELVTYKKLYGDKKHLREAIKNILSQPSFKKAHIEAKYGEKGARILAKALSLPLLNSLISKIFNGPYTIEKLEIKKIDSEHVELKLEIKW